VYARPLMALQPRHSRGETQQRKPETAKLTHGGQVEVGSE
jgi:hypothetical protein